MELIIAGVLFVVLLVGVTFAHRERINPERCWHCGYNVKDLPRCPECGKPTGPDA